MRLRRKHRKLLPRGGRRPVPAAVALERNDQADAVLRLRHLGDAAADRARLRRARQRRPDDRADLRQGPAAGKPPGARPGDRARSDRSEEHTSELQSLMRISYADFWLKKKKKHKYNTYQ